MIGLDNSCRMFLLYLGVYTVCDAQTQKGFSVLKVKNSSPTALVTLMYTVHVTLHLILNIIIKIRLFIYPSLVIYRDSCVVGAWSGQVLENVVCGVVKIVLYYIEGYYCYLSHPR